MAKNTSFDFTVSKTKINKPKNLGVMVQMPEHQHAHLNMHCEQQQVSVAEFCRQALAYILKKSGNPFPEVGELSDELKAYIREQRKAAAKRAAKKGTANEEDVTEEQTEETEETKEGSDDS